MSELPSNPGEKVYLLATISLKLRIPPKRKTHPQNYSTQSYSVWGHNSSEGIDQLNIAQIIIDVAKDQWSYARGSMVVNLPPRYRFTHADKDKIYQAAKHYVANLLTDAKS